MKGVTEEGLDSETRGPSVLVSSVPGVSPIDLQPQSSTYYRYATLIP